MLMHARAQQFYLSIITGSDTARMREVFTQTDTRLPAARSGPTWARGAHCSPAGTSPTGAASDPCMALDSSGSASSLLRPVDV